MKLTTIVGTVIAAVGLAACGSTAVTPTARPTLAPTVAATVAPTVAPTTAPTAIPTVAPTPTAKPTPKGIYVTTTCSGTAQGNGSITFHNVKLGDWAMVGYSDGPQYQFTSNPYTVRGWAAGRGPWKIWNDAKAEFIASGTVVISEC
jgi:hypothetical protein